MINGLTNNYSSGSCSQSAGANDNYIAILPSQPRRERAVVTEYRELLTKSNDGEMDIIKKTRGHSGILLSAQPNRLKFLICNGLEIMVFTDNLLCLRDMPVRGAVAWELVPGRCSHALSYCFPNPGFRTQQSLRLRNVCMTKVTRIIFWLDSKDGHLQTHPQSASLRFPCA